MTSRVVRVAMVAGEASGDLLSCHLIQAIRAKLPNAEFFGIGGPKMQAEGFDARWSSELLAVHGYVDALKRYRELSGIRRSLLAVLDCPYVRLLQDEIATFAAASELDLVFRHNKA